MAGMKGLIKWWPSQPLPRCAWRMLGRVAAAEDMPERLPQRGAVLAGPPDCTSRAVFDCPCPTKHRLVVNPDGTGHPFWNTEYRRPLSLRLRIDSVTPEQRCHFNSLGGKIYRTIASKEK